MTDFPNGISSMGVPVGGLFTKGKSYFVDPKYGSNSNTGDTIKKPLKTLAAAYDKTVSGNGDVIYLMSFDNTAANTTVYLSEAFTWDHDNTHLVGLCAPSMLSQRARIAQTSTATGVSPLITVSGNNCIFKNVSIYQGVADATSLVDVSVTGVRNYFENVHFAGPAHATMSAAGAASLKIDGGQENLFKHCVLGVDTATMDADATNLILDSAAARNTFEDCLFQAYISAAGFCGVTVADITGVDRWTLFKNCLFMTESTNSGTTQTSVFKTVGAQTGRIVLMNSLAFSDGGAVDWDSGNNSRVWNNQVAAAASAAGGILTVQ